jgi:signal transduction histidine kinase
VLENLAPQIAGTGADIVVDSLPTISGDSRRLTLLLQNLLDNALRFASDERKPQIRIEVQERDGSWQVCIHDNGIGIDPRYHDRIFEVFKRLHPRGRYDGTGIGLSIARKIVEQHRGRIWIESELGVGTAVCFTLPKDGGGGAAAVGPAEPGGGAEGSPADDRPVP